MKIYCFSGLGADERVFKFLELGDDFEIIPVAWIEPDDFERIESYSERICKTI